MTVALRPRQVGVVLVGLVFLLAGCARRVDVTGKIVENGKAIAQADLRCVHERGGSPIVTGLTDDEGRFILIAEGKRGVPPGNYEVTITYWKTKAGQPLPSGEKGTVLKGTDAAVRYSAMFIREITPQTTTLEIDVTGKARPVKD